LKKVIVNFYAREGIEQRVGGGDTGYPPPHKGEKVLKGLTLSGST